MGLLDTVIGALTGRRGGVGGLGGGAQSALLTALIGMLASGAARGQGGGGSGDGGGSGGLGDLIGQFTRGGLGDVIGSWVGTGQNASISGDQVSQVLGDDTIGNLAEQSGLSRDETVGQLSELLPQVVDRLTPDGRVPEGGLGGIGDILAQLSRR